MPAWVQELADPRTWPTRRRPGRSPGTAFAALLFVLLGLLPVLTPVLLLLDFPGRSVGLWLLWLLPLLGPVRPQALGPGDLSAAIAGAPRAEAGYFGRAFRGHVAESLIGWHRSGRVSERAGPGHRRQAAALYPQPAAGLPARRRSPLPDGQGLLSKSGSMLMFVKPVQLYFKPAVREKWLQRHGRGGPPEPDAQRRGRGAHPGPDRRALHPEIPEEPGRPHGHAVRLGDGLPDDRGRLRPRPPRVRLGRGDGPGRAHGRRLQPAAGLARARSSAASTPSASGHQGEELQGLQAGPAGRLLQDHRLPGLPAADGLPLPRAGPVHGRPLGHGGRPRRPDLRRAGRLARARRLRRVLQLPAQPGDPDQEAGRARGREEARRWAVPVGRRSSVRLSPASSTFLFVRTGGRVPVLKDVWWAVFLAPIGGRLSGRLCGRGARRWASGSRRVSRPAPSSASAYGLVNAYPDAACPGSRSRRPGPP
ncbi:MAG: hypothetical protein MZU79_05465 [Anaerotruncus sp.]|nr:hypothetical protein [Anaerotruncus sp.]